MGTRDERSVGERSRNQQGSALPAAAVQDSALHRPPRCGPAGNRESDEAGRNRVDCGRSAGMPCGERASYWFRVINAGTRHPTPID